MAQRRMISLDVIDTDAFLDMGQGSQLLYFHLNARADDDGFVASPKKVMRAIGAAEDDLRVLFGKKFLISFQDGVCVIKHWRINNFVRKDIYKETQYLDLKRTLFIRQNGAYTLSNDDRALPIPEGHFQLEDIVNETLTRRQLSIGKDSIGKPGELGNSQVKESFIPVGASLSALSESGDSIKPREKKSRYPNSKQVFSWFLKPEQSWGMNTTELKSAELLFSRGEKSVKGALAFCEEFKDDPLCPQILKPSDLEMKWPNLVAYKNKKNL